MYYQVEESLMLKVIEVSFYDDDGHSVGVSNS